MRRRRLVHAMLGRMGNHALKNDNRFSQTAAADGPIQIRCVSHGTSYNWQPGTSFANRNEFLGDTV